MGVFAHGPKQKPFRGGAISRETETNFALTI